jgi:PD-(D/E)XK endonuclease
VAPLKLKEDRAELEVARDLVRRGFRIAIPYGEDWDFDLIFCRPDSVVLERVQVKYTESDGEVISLRCASHSLTNGRIRRTQMYTAEMVDWMAVYDQTTDRCYYVPATELGNGRRELSLRLVPARNSQAVGVRYARDYVDPVARQQRLEMEPAGLEPATFAMQARRSPN